MDSRQIPSGPGESDNHNNRLVGLSTLGAGVGNVVPGSRPAIISLRLHYQMAQVNVIQTEIS